MALNILQWNAQSIRSKLTDLELLLIQEKTHLALISETWLEPASVITKYFVGIDRINMEEWQPLYINNT